MNDAQPKSLSLDTSLPLLDSEVYSFDDAALEPYSLDSSIGLSPLICDGQQDIPEFSPGSVHSQGEYERHTPQNIQSSSSHNSFELNSTYGIGDGDSMHNTVSYIPVETPWPVFHQYLAGDSSMIVNKLIQNYDRLTLASEVGPSFYAQDFQAKIMTGPERRPYSLLSPENSCDSNLMSPQMNWSPVNSSKSRLAPKKGRCREIPRNGNGIRKKNAKYEIPPGENLDNIDELITQARGIGDIENVVRLIRNKRLLRNRLAALESRERKKRYIEKLEKDNKQLNEDLDMATEELAKALKRANDFERRVASLKNMVSDMR